MAQLSNIPFVQPAANPQLKDLLDLLKKDIMLSLNCHAVATVQTFDSTNQTVTATLNYKKTFFQLDETTGLYNSVLVDYPILLDCPVVILSGGTAGLTFPIATGDQCLILFNDRDIDAWFANGQTAAVATARLHSFADAIALIGLFPANKSIASYDSTRAKLFNGTTEIGVSTTKVRVKNASTTLNTVLQTLVTDLQTLITQLTLLTVTCATPGNPSSPPINAAAIAAVSTSLSTLATQISGLLE